MIQEPLALNQPRVINFGEGCIDKMVDDLRSYHLKKVFVLTLPPIVPQLEKHFDALRESGMEVVTDTSIQREPTNEDFRRLLKRTKKEVPDGIIGIGGGSVMDIAKLLAAQINNSQSLEEITGIGKLKRRDFLLICVPTTSGTGSEVSPNAILLDEQDGQKKGIISPYLVPDRVYADPLLTVTLPSSVTAATGIDALTHCIEAYANRYAHPMIDMYALQGIRLIAAHLVKAVKDGTDIEARSAMLLGSMYGGICLGPVNTAAVHALSYPLGSRFHIAHGLSNALLLPHVLEFNLAAAPERYADIARAMGCPAAKTAKEEAKEGIHFISRMMEECEMPLTLSALNMNENVIESMAHDAMKVTRLLKNNVREVHYEDAIKIYQSAY